MGCSSSTGEHHKFVAIKDKYSTFDELEDGLRHNGLEASQLIVGIDMSGSNSYSGHKSYGRSLHDISVITPYEAFLSIVCPVLSKFDSDNMIPFFRFGDDETKASSVAPFDKGGMRDCHGLDECLRVYRDNVPRIRMSGPTTMAPLIREAIDLVKETHEYHILLILTDGEISDSRLDAKAVVEASDYPLSIVAVGIGDGPFRTLEDFDDNLPKRKFDNFQFVNFTELQQRFAREECPELLVATCVLQEIPDQYKAIRDLGYLD